LKKQINALPMAFAHKRFSCSFPLATSILFASIHGFFASSNTMALLGGLDMVFAGILARFLHFTAPFLAFLHGVFALICRSQACPHHAHADDEHFEYFLHVFSKPLFQTFCANRTPFSWCAVKGSAAVSLCHTVPLCHFAAGLPTRLPSIIACLARPPLLEVVQKNVCSPWLSGGVLQFVLLSIRPILSYEREQRCVEKGSVLEACATVEMARRQGGLMAWFGNVVLKHVGRVF
jgi:hypothetical protein